MVVSMMGVGALIGSLGTGPIANRIGRRMTLVALNAPYIIGFLILALSMNYWMLLTGRLLVGLGVGASCIVTPLYLSEIAAVDIRGQITSAHQLAICIGLVFVELLGLSGLSGPGKWRLMFGLGAVPSLAQAVGMLWYAPESPRFLAHRGDAAGTREALRSLRLDAYTEDEAKHLLAADGNTAQVVESWSFLRLLQNLPLAGKSLFTAVLLHVAQQFSGINVVFYFSSTLFAPPPGETSTIPAMISVLNLVMTIVSMWLVERAGRRLLALTSAAGMVLAGSAFTAFYIGGVRFASVLLILGYVAAFAVGMGPIPWLMMNELFPTQAAAAAISLAVGTNWICNFAVAATFGWLRAALGDWVLSPYIGFTLGFTVYAWFRLPETKGRPLGFL
jgi:sugar porter (SP) family MFS transporter